MIKVEYTKTHETPLQLIPTIHGLVATRPRTSVLVTDAELVLVNIFLPTNGKFPVNCIRAFSTDGSVKLPILISRTEKIEVGDKTYDTYSGLIVNVTKENFGSNAFDYYVKILALPEHFSQQLLSKIVSGELKDGDKVLLEVGEI